MLYEAHVQDKDEIKETEMIDNVGAPPANKTDPNAGANDATGKELSEAETLEALMLPFLHKQMREKLNEVKKDN